ncbi:alpha/beta fold hydrolase [Methylobacterium oryzae CBMB20]
MIAPDQIGFCKSSKPAAYQFTFRQLAENTHALLAKLGIERPILVGHSTGGMLAAHYALLYPKAVEQLRPGQPDRPGGLGRQGRAADLSGAVVPARAEGDGGLDPRLRDRDLLCRSLGAPLRALGDDAGRPQRRPRQGRRSPGTRRCSTT